MAAIGDVLVKFVADFAEFSTKMEAGQKSLENFGKAAADTNAKVSGAIGLLKTAVDAFAVTKIAAWVAETAKAADEQEQLGKKLGFTADQIEAMQKNAKAAGQTFDQNTAYFKTHRAELDAMTDAMRSQGELMSGTLRTAFADVNRELENFGRTIGTVRAQFQGGALDTVVGTIAKMIHDMGASLAYFEVYKGTIQSVRELMAIFTGAGGLVGVSAAERAAQQLNTLKTASLDAEVAFQRAEAAAKRAQEAVPAGGGDPFKAQADAIARGQGANTAQALADAKAAADAARAVRDQTAQAVKDAEANIAKAEKTIQDAAKDPKTTVPTVPTGGGGGGGRADDDLIEAQIKRYNALAKSAESAFATIKKSAQEPIEILQRNVAVQQQIDDIAGKLGAKYDQASAAQKQRLRDAVTAAEVERSLVQQRLQDNVKAAALEEKLGDGTEAMQHAVRDLNREYATGRVQIDTYNRALKQQSEQINQAALEARRYDDNLGSLAAGFEHAAAAYARQNDLYSQGEQVFSGLTSAMTEGLKALEGQSDKTFEQIALNFANMLADMALRAAVSQVFKTIFGAISGDVTAAAVPAGGFNAGIGANGLGWLTPRAGGGPVSAGQSYVVGERGPELFVPTAAGNIVPNGANGGGGDSITVNVDMNSTQGAADPAKMLQFGRQMKAAIKDVIQNEKRPGGSLYSRATG
jgi:hypothetical protein